MQAMHLQVQHCCNAGPAAMQGLPYPRRYSSRPHQQTACSSSSTSSSTSSQQVQASLLEPTMLQTTDIQRQLFQMQQLLQQQSSTITALQREVQQLKYQTARSPSTSGGPPLGVSQPMAAGPAPYAAAIGQTITTATRSSSSSSISSSDDTCPAGGSALRQGGCMTLEDFRALPNHIVLVRHAQSMGNVDATTYSQIPDYEVPLSPTGWEQATACGEHVKDIMEATYGGDDYKLFFMMSPYCRSRQTYVAMRQAFRDRHVAGIQEEVQLREQDFGNFQHPEKIKADIAERNRFGRFYYRFPDGESGADVLNRISILEDHLIRDMKAGKFGERTSLVLVTHGLTLRVFLMRWFNWTVESFLQAYNPPNASPLMVSKVSEEDFVRMSGRLDKRQTLQVKQVYRLAGTSMDKLGLTTTSTMEVIDLIGQEYMT